MLTVAMLDATTRARRPQDPMSWNDRSKAAEAVSSQRLFPATGNTGRNVHFTGPCATATGQLPPPSTAESPGEPAFDEVSATSPMYPIGGTLAKCDPFGIPSTSHWTGAAIIVQSRRTKTYIVTRSRTSTRPMPFSLAG
jgi:hypothetical protein